MKIITRCIRNVKHFMTASAYIHTDEENNLAKTHISVKRMTLLNSRTSYLEILSPILLFSFNGQLGNQVSKYLKQKDFQEHLGEQWFELWHLKMFSSLYLYKTGVRNSLSDP